MIEGQIELTIENSPYTLSAGDSFSYKNHLTSSYRNPGAVVRYIVSRLETAESAAEPQQPVAPTTAAPPTPATLAARQTGGRK